MDDLTHNCPDCHEVTRCPTQHTCGRTPEGTLPGHQPHKAERFSGPLLDWIVRYELSEAERHQIAGPRKGDT